MPDDISELSRALEALEGEALGSSPGGAPPGSRGRAPGRPDAVGLGCGSSSLESSATCGSSAAPLSRRARHPMPSTAAPAAGAMSGGLDDRLAEQLGLSPDADPTGAWRHAGL